MPKVAKAAPGTLIYTEGQTFDFGADGTRQVSEEEVEKLRRYESNGGPIKVEITETKKRKG